MYVFMPIAPTQRNTLMCHLFGKRMLCDCMWNGTSVWGLLGASCMPIHHTLWVCSRRYVSFIKCAQNDRM